MARKNSCGGASTAAIIVALLTREDVAKRLKTCTHTVARYTKRGLLPAVLINSRVVRYKPEDVEKLIQSSTIGRHAVTQATTPNNNEN